MHRENTVARFFSTKYKYSFAVLSGGKISVECAFDMEETCIACKEPFERKTKGYKRYSVATVQKGWSKSLKDVLHKEYGFECGENSFLCSICANLCL